MSACISREGEFGEHKLTDPLDPFTCQRCFVFDDYAATVRLVALEAAVSRVRSLADLWESEAIERGPNDKVNTRGVASMLRSALKPAEDATP